MVLHVTAPLRKALRQLEVEKQHINGLIAAVRAALATLGDTRRGTAPAPPRGKPKRRRMSVAARRAISQRMKAYWAKRKAATAKRKAKKAPTGA